MAKEYNVSKTAGVCCGCGRELSPGEAFVATLSEGEEELHREDFCPPCWQKVAEERQSQTLGVWHSRIPAPEEKKKLFVDDEMLVQFFERLDGSEEAAKINFRFVLTLVLMRKKLLIYERGEKNEDGQDAWTMRLKGTDRTFRVIDPHMDEEKIAQVSGQLSSILEADL